MPVSNGCSLSFCFLNYLFLKFLEASPPHSPQWGAFLGASCLVNQKEAPHFRCDRCSLAEISLTRHLPGETIERSHRGRATSSRDIFPGMFWQTTVGVTPKRRQKQAEWQWVRRVWARCRCLPVPVSRLYRYSEALVRWGNYLTGALRADVVWSSGKRGCSVSFFLSFFLNFTPPSKNPPLFTVPASHLAAATADASES